MKKERKEREEDERDAVSIDHEYYDDGFVIASIATFADSPLSPENEFVFLGGSGGTRGRAKHAARPMDVAGRAIGIL